MTPRERAARIRSLMADEGMTRAEAEADVKAYPPPAKCADCDGTGLCFVDGVLAGPTCPKCRGTGGAPNAAECASTPVPGPWAPSRARIGWEEREWSADDLAAVVSYGPAGRFRWSAWAGGTWDPCATGLADTRDAAKAAADAALARLCDGGTP